MNIQPIQPTLEADVRQLFNDAANNELIFKPLDASTFKQKFADDHPQATIITFVGTEQDRVVGFISGTVLKSSSKAYITMILVDQNTRKKGIGTALLKHFEQNIKENYPDVKSIDLIFFNPILLAWVVPNTDGHDHPGAPGVDIEADAYLFFKAKGYHTFVKQNLYYKNIKDYAYSTTIKSMMDSLKKKNLTITFYDQRVHTGFDDLFENLENPSWRQAIVNGLQKDDPVLIAADQHKMIGFTGPLHVQRSGRGYFAGIGVHSDYRGHGLGKVLFASLCYELSQLGATFMTLFTGENNPARKIYENEHFSIVKTFANMRKDVE